MKNLTLTFFIHDNPSHDVAVATPCHYDPEGVMGHHGPMENGDINLDALPENPERLKRMRTAPGCIPTEKHDGFQVMQMHLRFTKSKLIQANAIHWMAAGIVRHAEWSAKDAGRASLFMYAWVRADDGAGEPVWSELYVGTPCMTVKAVSNPSRNGVRYRSLARDMVIDSVKAQLVDRDGCLWGRSS